MTPTRPLRSVSAKDVIKPSLGLPGDQTEQKQCHPGAQLVSHKHYLTLHSVDQQVENLHREQSIYILGRIQKT